MVLAVKGNDQINVSWIYAGSAPNDHHCTVDFSFQAFPIIDPILSEGHPSGSIAFAYRPPFEHITFIVIDNRTTDEYQQLAFAVLMGDRDAAKVLADSITENYGN